MIWRVEQSVDILVVKFSRLPLAWLFLARCLHVLPREDFQMQHCATERPSRTDDGVLPTAPGVLR